MSNWILYDDFVERVKNHHHNAFSGLITGVSDSRHSFQVGFDHGEIVLLTYRVKKGLAALLLITQIERAKISEHPNGDIQGVTGEALDTGSILSRLTANTLDETTTLTTLIDDPTSPMTTGDSAGPRAVDASLKKVIEAAAIHHFGPIGAMVCEQHLANPDGDVGAIMHGIAQEVGASEADTRAFFQSVAPD
ncbi:MAG: hypothetical protein OEN02_08755 [Gammaproteobacteria bacterium]|nr:hypothetical protein [Gammaproteobacteria bacterium]MDH3534781.1 hypothetical protein [Gammaproteobacteria bacterium]